MGIESRATRPQKHKRQNTNEQKTKKHILTMTPPPATPHSWNSRAFPSPYPPSPTPSPSPSPPAPPPLPNDDDGIATAVAAAATSPSSAAAAIAPPASVVVLRVPFAVRDGRRRRRRRAVFVVDVNFDASSHRPTRVDVGGVRRSTSSYSRFGGNYDDDDDDDKYGIAVPFRCRSSSACGSS